MQTPAESTVAFSGDVDKTLFQSAHRKIHWFIAIHATAQNRLSHTILHSTRLICFETHSTFCYCCSVCRRRCLCRMFILLKSTSRIQTPIVKRTNGQTDRQSHNWCVRTHPACTLHTIHFLSIIYLLSTSECFVSSHLVLSVHNAIDNWFFYLSQYLAQFNAELENQFEKTLTAFDMISNASSHASTSTAFSIFGQIIFGCCCRCRRQFTHAIPMRCKSLLLLFRLFKSQA